MRVSYGFVTCNCLCYFNLEIESKRLSLPRNDNESCTYSDIEHNFMDLLNRYRNCMIYSHMNKDKSDFEHFYKQLGSVLVFTCLSRIREKY